MIVINIYDNPAVVTIPAVKPFAADPCYGVRIRKCIDGSVEQDSLLYGIGVVEVFFAPDVIRYEISDTQCIVAK